MSWDRFVIGMALKINESFDMDELISENKFLYLRLLIFVCVKIVVNFLYVHRPIVEWYLLSQNQESQRKIQN